MWAELLPRNEIWAVCFCFSSACSSTATRNIIAIRFRVRTGVVRNVLRQRRLSLGKDFEEESSWGFFVWWAQPWRVSRSFVDEFRLKGLDILSQMCAHSLKLPDPLLRKVFFVILTSKADFRTYKPIWPEMKLSSFLWLKLPATQNAYKPNHHSIRFRGWKADSVRLESPLRLQFIFWGQHRPPSFRIQTNKKPFSLDSSS